MVFRWLMERKRRKEERLQRERRKRADDIRAKYAESDLNANWPVSLIYFGDGVPDANALQAARPDLTRLGDHTAAAPERDGNYGSRDHHSFKTGGGFGSDSQDFHTGGGFGGNTPSHVGGSIGNADSHNSSSSHDSGSSSSSSYDSGSSSSSDSGSSSSDGGGGGGGSD